MLDRESHILMALIRKINEIIKNFLSDFKTEQTSANKEFRAHLDVIEALLKDDEPSNDDTV